ncbi:neuroendocrine convertase 1-like [Ruditapes philippinarum]|uniref:neuroendocrine convertase 1-like n=1 Tax=Ruditapes philippinarum TaxID=129788 RepID=UPI00295B8DDF|nr:neuroendocrine convertase 1-like [Ruditapes philippinarum]
MIVVFLCLTQETTTHDNKCDDFRGTSASTALASGIIALTLQANPNITWRDLQHIIVLSASHERLENTGQLQKNAAGLQFDSFFGFGLMNAAKMTLMARNWTNVPPQKQKTVKEAQLQIRLPRENVIRTYLQVDPCAVNKDCINNLEHVQISLSYTKQHDDLLDIDLCSPHRTCSQLLSRKENVNRKKNLRGWRIWNFTSVHFWGENPAGNWTLVVNISHAINQKQLEVKNLALTLFGTASQPFKSFYNVTEKNINDKTDFSDSNYDHDEDLIDDEEEIVVTVNESYISYSTRIIIVLSICAIALCAIAIFHF